MIEEINVHLAYRFYLFIVFFFVCVKIKYL